MLVPPATASVTTPALALRLLPAASFAWTVTLTVDPAATVGDDTDTVDCESETAPGVTLMVGIVVEMATPPIVPENVFAVPDSMPLKVAV